MTTKTKILMVAALAALVPILVTADAMKEHHEGRMRTFLVLRIADALNLSDERALAVSRVFRDAEAKREEARKKRDEIEDKIRESLKKPKPDSAALSKLVDQAVELDKQQGQAREQIFEALKKVLSVEEQAKLVLLRPELRHEMHSMGGPRWEHGPGHEGGPEGGHEHGHRHGHEHGEEHGRPEAGPVPGDES